MPTVTALKTLFQAQIAPGDDEEFLRILTEADLRLTEFGRWGWTRTKVTLTPVDGIITLPTTYASILGARVGKGPVDVFDQDYEFCPGGPGEIDLGHGHSKLIDQGMNDVVVSSAGDPEVVEPRRQYKVTGYLADDDVVTALLHYAPVTLMDPDIADSMVPDDATVNTRCPDSTALKLMMLGILMEEAHDHGGARSFISDALKGLDNKEQAQRGGAQRTIQARPMGRNVRRIRGWR